MQLEHVHSFIALLRRYRTTIPILGLLAFSVPAGAQIAPLSFAAAGVSTEMALNKADDMVSQAIMRAGSVGSMTSAKVARDVQLLIADARQNLHEELTDNWNTLDKQKVDVLRVIDEDLVQLNQAMTKGGLLEQDTYLDISRVVATIPWTGSDPVLRSAEGTNLVYRGTGFYRVTLHGNVFDGDVAQMSVKVGDRKLLASEVTISKGRSANALDLDLSASTLKPLFKDAQLAFATMRLSLVIPNRSWRFWKGDTPAEYPITLQLLPKYPIVKYSLIALDEEPTVDRNATLKSWGPIVQIPGCGNHDCNINMNVCADAPLGSEVIVDSSQEGHYDQLTGFHGQFQAEHSVAGERFCRVFHQQNSESRNVQIQVVYHPPSTTLVPANVQLHIVSPEESAEHPLPPVAQLAFGETYLAYFDKQMKSFRFAATFFTGEILSSSSAAKAPPQLLLRRSEDKSDPEMSLQVQPPS
jgi:hypothetical protein